MASSWVKKYCSVCTTRWLSHESSSIAFCRRGRSGGPSYICCDFCGGDFAVPSHCEVSTTRPVPGSDKIALGAGTGVSSRRGNKIRRLNLNLAPLAVASTRAHAHRSRKSSPHREGPLAIARDVEV